MWVEVQLSKLNPIPNIPSLTVCYLQHIGTYICNVFEHGNVCLWGSGTGYFIKGDEIPSELLWG